MARARSGPAHRVVEGLRWAEATEKPAFAARSRPRGAKAAGLRYERALAKALPEAQHGLWFKFIDQNGPGLCSPDLVLDLGSGPGSALAILEVKYTFTPAALTQLNQLYRPVLAMATGRRTLGIVVCRHLVPGMPSLVLCETLAEALEASRRAIPVLHWLGPRLGPPLTSPISRPEFGLDRRSAQA